MDAIMTLVSVGAMGAMAMFAIVIMCINISKQKFPVLFVCIEERQGGIKVKLRKGSIIRDKK